MWRGAFLVLFLALQVATAAAQPEPGFVHWL